jgi:phosphohistidine phosphatase
MLKTLVILRHGKSTWDYGTVADWDRPLKEIGITNTQIVSQKLMEQGIVPELIMSSHAIRALHTALIVAGEFRYPVEKVIINPIFYGESEDEILQIVKSVDNQYNSLFIVGHNPVFTMLTNRFLKKTIDNLPTSGAAALSFEISSWNEISKKNVKSEFTFFSKNS